MSLVLDIERGKEVAENLYYCFNNEGILGQNEMPEDIIPDGIERGSLEHVLFITLTVSLDYLRDAPALWESARETHEDPETKYLFKPELIHKTPYDKFAKDLQKYKLSKRYNKDSYIWRTNATTFHKKWNGDPRKFLEDCNWDSLLILKRLKSDTHDLNGRKIKDFTYLGGDKIGPLWLRMLRDNVEINKLKNLEKVPIPVDIHVARASLATGVVHGQFEGRLEDIFNEIRSAWFESVKRLNIEDREMIALDVDESLWHLSKYGCTNRDEITGKCPSFNKCEAKEFCIKGQIEINNNVLSLNTWK
jgi:hypothetical protein